MTSRTVRVLVGTALAIAVAGAVCLSVARKEREDDDTRPLARWLAQPAFVIPKDIRLPKAPSAPPLESARLFQPNLRATPDDGNPAVSVPATIALRRWNDASTDVLVREQPRAPLLIVSKNDIRFPVADFAFPLRLVDAGDIPSARSLEDAMTRLRLVLAWSRDELRTIPLADAAEPARLSLVLVADRDTPFATLARVVETVAAADWGEITFAAENDKGFGGFKTPNRDRDWWYAAGEFKVDLVIAIRPDGFRVGNRYATIASGCDDTGAGPAVPKPASAPYDYAALRKCLTKVRAEVFKSGHPAVFCTITAAPSTPYDTIMKVIDAVTKKDDGEDLFPDFDVALTPKRWRIVSSPPSREEGAPLFDVVSIDSATDDWTGGSRTKTKALTLPPSTSSARRQSP